MSNIYCAKINKNKLNILKKQFDDYNEKDYNEEKNGAPIAEKSSENLYLRCECFTEGLFVSKELDENEVWICRYQIGGFYGMSFIQKIKLIYKIFRYGRVLDDEIILSKDKALLLSNFLKYKLYKK